MKEFKLQTDYIELIKLLKLLRLVESGGQAKTVVEEGLVSLNGKTEFRKRAKLKRGDKVQFESNIILIK